MPAPGLRALRTSRIAVLALVVDALAVMLLSLFALDGRDVAG